MYGLRSTVIDIAKTLQLFTSSSIPTAQYILSQLCSFQRRDASQPLIDPHPISYEFATSRTAPRTAANS